MAFDEDAIDRLRRRIEALEDGIVDDSQKAVVDGLRALAGEMESVVRGLSVQDGKIENSIENMRRAEAAMIQVEAALREIAETAKDPVLNSAANIAEAAATQLQLAGYAGFDDPFAAVDADAMATLMNLNLDSFNGGAQATAQVIRRELFAQIVGFRTIDEAVTALRFTVEGDKDRAGNPLGIHAKTWAMSAVTQFQGQYFAQAIPEDRIAAYYYSGPKDSANREFCSDRAGKYYAPDRITQDVANNPIANSSMNLPGGWNCRHVLIPVSPEEVEVENIEVIS